MKKLITLLALSLAVSIYTNSNAQGVGLDNAEEIQTIISPNDGDSLNSLDSFDIVVRIKNLGPNYLITADQFKVSYSVGDGGTNSRSFDTLITVGGSRDMQVNESRQYTIATNYVVNGNNSYATCVSVDGTNIYPNNTEKFPGECVRFIVSIPENNLKIEKLFYANGALQASLNTSQVLQFSIFNLAGKEILSRQITNSKVNIPFNVANGFYFIKLTDKNDNTATEKFVVN